MKKAELIAAMGQAVGLTKAEARECLELFGNIVAAEMRKGGEVSLPRLGKLKVKVKPERRGRNPRTGEAVTVSARRVIAFSASSSLKQSMEERNIHAGAVS